MPYLKLKIVSGSEIGQNDSYSFSQLGGSIGRSEECDWTLIDSDRFVSKKHLVITYTNQQFVLTDVSSNGVIINSTSAPLGRGNEHILQAIDTLVIGKHVVQVEEMNFETEEKSPQQNYDSDDDLLGLVMGGNTETTSIPEPMQQPQANFQIPETPNLFSEIQSESELGLEDILTAPVKTTIESDVSNAREQTNPFNIGSAPAAPASVKSAESLIPDDWEMFDTASTSNTLEPLTESDKSLSPLGDEQFFGHNQQENNLQHPSIEELAENTPSISDEVPLQVIQNSPQEAIESQPLEKPKPQDVIQQNTAHTSQNGMSDAVSNTTNDDFFTTLYEKLGLSKEFKASINRDDFADDLATILLSTTQGLMSLLASRTAFKQESRLSSTLIQPRSNNPIKFSIDPVDTLEMLLVKKKKGYMSVGDSYDEAMEDIQLHQMAFMSGLQGTLDGVLAQLAPEEIEKQVNKKSQRFLGLNSNSQCWQIYKEKQPLLAKSVKENLNDVLGTYFSEAYQSQINSFKNEK